MNDPVNKLSEIGSNVPLPDDALTARIRAGLVDTIIASAPKTIRPRRHMLHMRTALAATVAMVCVIAIGVLALPGNHGATLASAAALRQVARVAAAGHGPSDTLGRNQYVLTRYSQIAVSTETLTQAKLDAMVRTRIRQMQQNRTSGHMLVACKNDGKPCRNHGVPTGLRNLTPAEQAKNDLADAARLRRVRRGIKLSDLPTDSITSRYSTSTASWISDSGVGAGGGLPGASLKYGNLRQREAVKKLQRLGIFVGASNLIELALGSDRGRFEDLTWPGSTIATLPTDPEQLSHTLRAKRLPGGRAGHFEKIRSDEAFFHVAIGLLRSPFATPALRSGVVLALGRLRGIEIRQDATDAKGRSGLGLGLTIGGMVQEVVFDQQTSQVLGVNYKVFDPSRVEEMSSIGASFDSGELRVAFEPTIVVQGAPVCRFTVSGGIPAETYCASKVRPVGSALPAN